MDRVLVVGTGLTGSVTAALCRQQLPESPQISIWDKSHGAGGRMSTSRSPNDDRCTVDLGAQYITLKPEYKTKRSSLYQELVSVGILAPLKGKIENEKFGGEDSQHFVASKGVSSIVKYYLALSDSNIEYDYQVNHIDYINSNDGVKVKVGTTKGITEEFDAVILTQPVPQILQLTGQIRNKKSPEVYSNLKNVTYSSRFAVGLFYEPGTKLNYEWCAKYFPQHECIVYVSIDNKRRGIENGCAPSVVVHTNVTPFSLKNLEEDKETVGPVIMKYLKDLLPDLPKPKSVKYHKWRYSQVHKSYANKPGCIILESRPLVVLGGDGFTHSGFDGCIDSAEKIVDTLNKVLSSSL
ncbi:hypothetical protein LOTGIDRAFT_127891 [Lottia gigantea]|uniref:Amine oxidase domain-containing protein n=1 Tax=Lottia gigantea TaxID=225164 RepID=V4BF12_LOTGI|nr:hypothetical protein LOTGIDRAFT_127891 [Lottia gigantea]ESO87424.1 hypothetical protein LOTGIDRAFT_127891 [Lottia gigantea]